MLFLKLKLGHVENLKFYYLSLIVITAQNMRKPLMENFIFCAVNVAGDIIALTRILLCMNI